MSTAQSASARAPRYVPYEEYDPSYLDEPYDPIRPRPARSGGGGRHRAPQESSVMSKAVTTTGVTVALVGSFAAVAGPASAAADASGWAGVRQCESGGNYSTNTGNGYYGAYQFSAQTWHALGYSGLPSDASPATQDEAAQKLYAQSGAGQWPVCGRYLAGVAATPPATHTETATTPSPSLQPTTPVSKPDTTLAPTMPTDSEIIAAVDQSPKNFPGTTLSQQYSGEIRLDTLRWQAAMRKKDFVVPLDGRYGPQTAGLASFYSFLTKVDDGKTGVVGPQIWSSTLR